MAALALAAVLPEMGVVLRMAIATGGVELHLAGRPFVTAGACDFGVSAGECKVGFPCVVEFPDSPAVRCVTARAIFAEAAFVSIVRPMTSDALLIGIAIGTSGVALLARNGDVKSNERELRQVMVEGDARLPAGRRMALIAFRAEFAAMHITRAMTADAARLQVLCRRWSSVARVTRNFLVTPFELPPGIALMIEGSRQPFVIAVTAAALASEATGMRILSFMASLAITRQRIVQPAIAVAVRTIEPCVSAWQREARLPGVIELCALPSCRRMTIRALRAAFAAVHVIGGVTRDASLRSCMIAVAEMTGEASDFFVFVAQRKGRSVVIERDVRPRNGVVTVGALFPQLAFVRLHLLMARMAVRRRLAEFLPLRVASVARNRGVRALQGKVSARVIELVATEFDDVGIPAEMVRMTGMTLQFALRVRDASVIAVASGEIRADRLMARHTELGLALAIAAVMTIRAALLELRVSGSELARHEKRLGIHRISPPGHD